MATDTIVDSDLFTRNIAGQLSADLSSRALQVRLYNQPLNPSPATPLTSFTGAECIFDTYAPLDIVDAWQIPVQIQPGEWASVNGPFSWAAPLTTPDVIVGIFVSDAFGNVYMSYEFSNPIPFSIGASPFVFNLQHNQWSRVLLPGPF